MCILLFGDSRRKLKLFEHATDSQRRKKVYRLVPEKSLVTRA